MLQPDNAEAGRSRRFLVTLVFVLCYFFLRSDYDSSSGANSPFSLFGRKYPDVECFADG